MTTSHTHVYTYTVVSQRRDTFITQPAPVDNSLQLSGSFHPSPRWHAHELSFAHAAQQGEFGVAFFWSQQINDLQLQLGMGTENKPSKNLAECEDASDTDSAKFKHSKASRKTFASPIR